MFFLDENFGKNSVALALRDAGVDVESYYDHFAPGVIDSEWIPIVVAKGWVIVTADAKFRYRPNEKEALIAAGARVFVLTGAQMSGADQARILIASQPAMERVLERTKPPFVAVVTKSGLVEVRWPSPDEPEDESEDPEPSDSR